MADLNDVLTELREVRKEQSKDSATLAEMSGELKGRTRLCDERHERLDDRVSGLSQTVKGNSEKPGLLTRVDRVEQTIKHWRRNAAAAWAFIVAALGASIKAMIGGD